MSYTPGYTELADRLMRRRSARSHAWLAVPLIEGGATVLDAGCGPGTITCDLAELVGGGRVIGVDAAAVQLERARRLAGERGVEVDVIEADTTALPIEDSSVDVALAHALLEHLPEPERAVHELIRVTRPGGSIVSISPDLGGWILAPHDPAAEAAIEAYAAIQSANGGNLSMGRRLGSLMVEAGLADVAVDARYEVYEDPMLIADYLALRLEASPRLDAQLDANEASRRAQSLRRWAARPASVFCQAWVGSSGRVPGD